MPIQLRSIFEKVTTGRDLSRDEARWVFERIMAGEVSETVIAALLGCLAVKGEAVDELVGAAEAMRAAAVRVRCDADCIDTCGTGGDGISTFNVSTTAAIIAAAAGATVAKHGNRSTTRVCGSTEVLTLLGIDVEAHPALVERSLAEARIGYLNARLLHPAMKYAAPVRQALPMRTIFNLLGPLTNPAGARRQVLGVPRPELVEKMAEALLALGATHAWVVHGDGLCDLTITGSTLVIEVRGGRLRRFTLNPEDAGLPRARLDALRVVTPQDSADMVVRILEGERGPARDHALLNAAAALVVAGIIGDWQSGILRAGEAIDSGAALDTLKAWRITSNKSR
jgi:anthranilate phosphoribosyltransferase